MNEELDVREFQVKVLRLVLPSEPGLLDRELFTFRSKCLQEELDEFVIAHSEGNLLDAADALVDLVYFAHGTAQLMGIPWEKVWSEVQQANMKKILGFTKRNFAIDAKKPETWTAPDHSNALGVGPWRTHGAVKY